MQGYSTQIMVFGVVTPCSDVVHY